MKKKVLIAVNGDCPYIPEMRKILNDAGIETKQADLGNLSEEGLIKQAADCVSAIAGPEHWTKKVFDSLPQFRCIIKSGVGLDAIDLEEATKHGVVVANTPGQNAAAVAEMACTMILSSLRRTIFCNNWVHGKRLGKLDDIIYSHELSSLTVGLVGFGNIARTVAQMLSGFGCQFLACDVKPNYELAEKMNVKIVSFEEVIRRSDVISLHVPLTKETKYSINKDTFQMMKRNAIVVNTCRGGVIHEGDLYDALKKHVIQAAALDVTEIEPLAEDSPLLTLDNIQFTPHTATATYEAMRNLYFTCAKQTIQFYEEQPIDNLVNPDYVKYLKQSEA